MSLHSPDGARDRHRPWRAWAERTLTVLDAAAAVLAGGILLAMVALLAFGPVQALLGVGGPVQWLTEVAELGLLQLGFLGAAVALRRGGHPALDLAVRRLPPRGRRVAAAAADVAILATGLLFLGLGVSYVAATRATGGTLATAPVPLWPFYLCYPLGGALVAAFAAGHRLAPVEDAA